MLAGLYVFSTFVSLAAEILLIQIFSRKEDKVK